MAWLDVMEYELLPLSSECVGRECGVSYLDVIFSARKQTKLEGIETFHSLLSHFAAQTTQKHR